jgi:SAM-dependent methyltransferase
MNPVALDRKPTVTNIFPREELGDLLFGQQHIYTQPYFAARVGQSHTVALDQFPHYEFLTNSLNAPYDRNAYSDYLECSWQFYHGKKNTSKRRRAQVEHYLDLYLSIHGQRLADNPITKPAQLCRRPDGRTIIVDGNHRCAIALYLGLNMPVDYVSPEGYLGRVVELAADEFYGTKRMGRPYQSIYDRGTERIAGRRDDIYQRIQQVEAADLEGKSVLDLGCNIGMNCYLAAERGAARVLGVEASPRIASAAVRLNAYFAAPCEFLVHDLNSPLDAGPFDTVFCFSLWDHLKSTDALVESIRRSVKKTLYFEGHAGSSRANYRTLLDGGLFSHIALIGYGHDGIHTDKRTRPFFRCEV